MTRLRAGSVLSQEMPLGPILNALCDGFPNRVRAEFMVERPERVKVRPWSARSQSAMDELDEPPFDMEPLCLP